MNIHEYKQSLLLLIEEYSKGALSKVDFISKAKKLGKELDTKGYSSIDDFDDKDFGWAKYWIEETDFYGIDEVLENKFDFMAFYKNVSVTS
jgi:hypothetical protein